MLSMPALYSQLRLMFFAPFLIIACYQKPLGSCLWLAFFCGLLLDLFSSGTRFGLHALNFCVTILVLYPQRRNFFADSLSTLPIMTFGFSLFSTLLMASLLYFLESRNVFSWSWIFSDLIFMPILDAFYSFFVFILAPLALVRRGYRRNKRYY